MFRYLGLVFFVVIIFLVLLFDGGGVLSHSGGTDSSGGHYNRKTGEYHYHGPGLMPYPVNDFSPETAYPVKKIWGDQHYIQIDMNGTLKNVTLMGVRARDGDTDEFLKRLLLGEHIYLRFDSSGSKSQVYLFRAPDGLFVNLEMLRQGYGIVWTNPTFAFLELFTQYESIAKIAEKGIWKPKPKESKVKTLWD